MKQITRNFRLTVFLLSLCFVVSTFFAGPPSTTSAAQAVDIAGNYNINGATPDGQKYKGKLAITKRGSVYQFSWVVDKEYDGVGIQQGNVVAVAYATGDGKGCGVVNYRITSNGVLDGRWGEWGVNESGKETASRVGSSKDADIVGEYIVNGANYDGSAYKGKLFVTAEGATYKFSWKTGNDFEGTGIKQGSYVSVGFGSDTCGFVSYVIQPNGTLDGKWGAPGEREIGTEKATKN
jgi:hypothetical protein